MESVSIEVDELTNCIRDAKSQVEYETVLIPLAGRLLRRHRKAEWTFDWRKEGVKEGRMVYAVVREDSPEVVEGLISLEALHDHVFIHLIESAKRNVGAGKKHVGVAGNLFAFACKVSFELGFGGFVAFQSKTNLVQHYMDSIGAKVLYGDRLVLEPDIARQLVLQYF